MAMCLLWDLRDAGFVPRVCGPGGAVSAHQQVDARCSGRPPTAKFDAQDPCVVVSRRCSSA